MSSPLHNDNVVTEFHLFAGIGGGIYGGHLLGHKCIAGVEIDKFCQTVLKQRQKDGWMPPFEIYDDVTKIDGSDFKGTFDVLCGGFPCQAFSQAAHGNNISSKNLWPAMFKFVLASDAPIVFGENVTREAIELAENDLLTAGYTVQKCKLSCDYLGADHPRPRYWLLAVKDKNTFQKVADQVCNLPKLEAYCWTTSPHEIEYPTEIPSKAPQFRAVGNAQSPFAAATAFRILVNRHLDNGNHNIIPTKEEISKVFTITKTWIKETYGEDCMVHTPTTMGNYHYASMQKHPVCRNYVKVFGKPTPIEAEYLMGFPIGASSPNPLPHDIITTWNVKK